MARLTGFLLLTLLLAGCMGSQPGPVSLAPVSGDIPARDRPTPVGVPDCTSETVQAGPTLIARIMCKDGSGHAEAELQGCQSRDGEPSWFTVQTAEGRLAKGNATATVLRDSDVLARLSIAAAQEDGKEAMLDAAAGYTLHLDLEGWQGEWVQASVECPA